MCSESHVLIGGSPILQVSTSPCQHYSPFLASGSNCASEETRPRSRASRLDHAGLDPRTTPWGPRFLKPFSSCTSARLRLNCQPQAATRNSRRRGRPRRRAHRARRRQQFSRTCAHHGGAGAQLQPAAAAKALRAGGRPAIENSCAPMASRSRRGHATSRPGCCSPRRRLASRSRNHLSKPMMPP